MIEYLSLAKNHLGESAGVELGPAVADNSSLRVLDLSWNNIRRKGAVALSQGLKVKSKLSDDLRCIMKC